MMIRHVSNNRLRLDYSLIIARMGNNVKILDKAYNLSSNAIFFLSSALQPCNCFQKLYFDEFCTKTNKVEFIRKYLPDVNKLIDLLIQVKRSLWELFQLLLYLLVQQSYHVFVDSFQRRVLIYKFRLFLKVNWKISQNIKYNSQSFLSISCCQKSHERSRTQIKRVMIMIWVWVFEVVNLIVF